MIPVPVIVSVREPGKAWINLYTLAVFVLEWITCHLEPNGLDIWDVFDLLQKIAFSRLASSVGSRGNEFTVELLVKQSKVLEFSHGCCRWRSDARAAMVSP